MILIQYLVIGVGLYFYIYNCFLMVVYNSTEIYSDTVKQQNSKLPDVWLQENVRVITNHKKSSFSNDDGISAVKCAKKG